MPNLALSRPKLQVYAAAFIEAFQGRRRQQKQQQQKHQRLAVPNGLKSNAPTPAAASAAVSEEEGRLEVDAESDEDETAFLRRSRRSSSTKGFGDGVDYSFLSGGALQERGLAAGTFAGVPERLFLVINNIDGEQVRSSGGRMRCSGEPDRPHVGRERQR